MFLANLNVFFPCFLFLTFVGFCITAGAGAVASIVVCVSLNFALIALWLGVGLAPELRSPHREGRYRSSQLGLTILNVLALVAFGGPLLLAEIMNDRRYGAYLWYALPVAPLCMIFWPMSLFGVWSSRADPFMDKEQ